VGANFKNFQLLSLTKGGVIVRDISTGKGKFSSDMGTSQEVRKGDFVFCLFDVPETPRTVGLSAHNGMITSAYTVFEPRALSPERVRYLELFYIAMDDRKLLSPLYSGLRHTIPPPRLLGTKTPQPPPSEQDAIVRFLDHANRKIDGFIRAKRMLIGLLNEQKQAIIHRAVTRGLNPDVPLKPSGIPWLGDIPKHWEVKRMKYLLKEIDDRSSDGSETLLRVSQYTGITPRMAQDGSGEADTRAESLVGYKLARKGDMVINIMLAWNGSLAVSEQEGIVSPAYCVYRFKNEFHPWFFHHLLRTTTYKSRIRIASTGVIESRLRLYSDDLGRIEAIVPPPDEQRSICSSILGETRHLSAAIARTEREIALMQEYRTRLTADIVTGKLDVREAAAKLPEPVVEEASNSEIIEEETELEEAE
jgi:type I restriction enzyme S subunit